MSMSRLANHLFLVAFFAVLAALVAWHGWGAWPQVPHALSAASLEILHSAKQTAFVLAGGVASVVDALAGAVSALTACI